MIDRLWWFYQSSVDTELFRMYAARTFVLVCCEISCLLMNESQNRSLLRVHVWFCFSPVSTMYVSAALYYLECALRFTVSCEEKNLMKIGAEEMRSQSFACDKQSRFAELFRVACLHACETRGARAFVPAPCVGPARPTLFGAHLIAGRNERHVARE